ncbi:MAG TPA: hypothetical protein VME44_29475, partial [Streptosporangiaceae bacterium]|nr:hypothetical protein [Streptosporangiaceae bacterium]
GHELRRRFAEQRQRAQRRRRATVPRPAAAALTALCVGGVASAFLPPVPLLHTTQPSRAASSRLSLLTGTEAYLRLGGRGGAYYPVTSVHLSNATSATDEAAASAAGLPQAGLSFQTSSLVLLGKVLRAGMHGDRIGDVSLAIRKPGPGGRPVTELVEAFRRGVISSFTEHVSGRVAGSVSLMLAVSHLAATPAALRRAGPFAALPGSSRTLVTRASLRISQASGGPASIYAVTAVQLKQTGAGGRLDLSLTTSSRPLLHVIHRYAEGSAARIPVLTLSVRAASAGPRPATTLTDIFTGLSVGAFAENLSGSFSGTATLVVSPR